MWRACGQPASRTRCVGGWRRAAAGEAGGPRRPRCRPALVSPRVSHATPRPAGVRRASAVKTPGASRPLMLGVWRRPGGWCWRGRGGLGRRGLTKTRTLNSTWRTEFVREPHALPFSPRPSASPRATSPPPPVHPTPTTSPPSRSEICETSVSIVTTHCNEVLGWGTLVAHGPKGHEGSRGPGGLESTQPYPDCAWGWDSSATTSVRRSSRKSRGSRRTRTLNSVHTTSSSTPSYSEQGGGGGEGHNSPQ